VRRHDREVWRRSFMTTKKTRVAVLGASGYGGAEALRLLLGHPAVEIAMVCAERSAGQPLGAVFPQFRGRLDQTLEKVDVGEIAKRAEVVFSALPHGEGAQTITALLAKGLRIFDLSADFRLEDRTVHEEWYGHGAARPDGTAYGMPERHREAIRGARLVACPGCYPTAAILALAPLLDRELVSSEGLVVDAKSGVSGAGRTPSLATHLPEAAEGLRPYKVAGTHRHTAEIEQELGRAAGRPVRLTFTPHLVPMARGILACVYAAPTDAARPAGDYQRALEEAYRAEPFVDVLDAGLPDTAFVRGSNRVQVAVRLDQRAGRVVAMSAIDNLVKGAAGQAIQCMNLALGLPETAGLDGVALFP
jgi:N-acetyl-gamma-glutamyl-phosphate reductase